MSVITARTLGDALDEVAGKYPSYEALVFKDQRITYAQLRDRANRLAKGLLKLGVKKGDNVAIWMGNRPEWVYLEYAVAKVGAVLATVNTRNRVHETEFILNQSEAKFLMIPDRFINIPFLEMLREMAPELDEATPGDLHAARLPALRTVICVADDTRPGTFSFEAVMALGDQVPDDELAGAQSSVAPNDPLLIIYTSGTTGKPKGAVLSHWAPLSHMAVNADWEKIVPGDRMLFGLPLFHAGGSVEGVMMNLTTASAMCLLETWDAEEALRTVERESCTTIIVVPTMAVMMLEHANFAKYNTKTLRGGFIGGAPAPVELIRALIEKLGVREICSTYGLTECSTLQTSTKPGDPVDLVSTTIGTALPDLELSIQDPETRQMLPNGTQGEICCRGPVNMIGYYKNPTETAKTIDKDGWLHTGDLGVRRDDGYFQITGRVKDMFIVGGSNAYPAEIENFLYNHPKIKQVHVAGVPDHRLGEVCMAFIELRQGETATAEEIVDFCKGKLANYKTPRYVKFLKELDFPMTPSNKIQKFKLREQAIQELGLKKETVV